MFDDTIMWKLSYGMYVLGAMDGDRPCGCIINTASQVTVVPVKLTISLSKDNYTHEVLLRSRKFSLSVMSVDTDPLNITYLGFRSGRDFNKFDDVEHDIFHGLPIIKSNPSSVMICEITDIIDAGTHSVFLAQVIDGKNISDSVPMTYAYYQNVVKGKTPKNAPTFKG